VLVAGPTLPGIDTAELVPLVQVLSPGTRVVLWSGSPESDAACHALAGAPCETDVIHAIRAAAASQRSPRRQLLGAIRLGAAKRRARARLQ
jgi:hypothetical protein